MTTLIDSARLAAQLDLVLHQALDNELTDYGLNARRHWLRSSTTVAAAFTAGLEPQRSTALDRVCRRLAAGMPRRLDFFRVRGDLLDDLDTDDLDTDDDDTDDDDTDDDDTDDDDTDDDDTDDDDTSDHDTSDDGDADESGSA